MFTLEHGWTIFIAGETAGLFAWVDSMILNSSWLVKSTAAACKERAWKHSWKRCLLLCQLCICVFLYTHYLVFSLQGSQLSQVCEDQLRRPQLSADGATNHPWQGHRIIQHLVKDWNSFQYDVHDNLTEGLAQYWNPHKHSKNNSSNMMTEHDGTWQCSGNLLDKSPILTYSLNDFFIFSAADQGPRVLDAGLRCKEPSFQVAFPCLEFHLADDPAIGMSRSKRVMDRQENTGKENTFNPTNEKRISWCRTTFRTMHSRLARINNWKEGQRSFESCIPLFWAKLCTSSSASSRFWLSSLRNYEAGWMCKAVRVFLRLSNHC